MSDNHLIEIRDVSFAYDQRPILKNINMVVPRGKVVSIMGGSGCGKTTLLKHIIGLKSPASGDVFFDKINFWKSTEAEQEAVKRRFGVLFQGGALWSSLTLAENVGLPLGEYTDLGPAEIRDVVSFKLALVGLAGYEEFYPSELSGGMRKRGSLARAIALDPEILFFDEPSAGLDPPSSRRMDDLILEIRDSLKTTIVVVTHELDSILRIGNNSVFLDADTRTMIGSGDPKQLRTSSPEPRVREFLGGGTA